MHPCTLTHKAEFISLSPMYISHGQLGLWTLDSLSGSLPTDKSILPSSLAAISVDPHLGLDSSEISAFHLGISNCVITLFLRFLWCHSLPCIKAFICNYSTASDNPQPPLLPCFLSLRCRCCFAEF